MLCILCTKQYTNNTYSINNNWVCVPGIPIQVKCVACSNRQVDCSKIFPIEGRDKSFQ